MRSRAGSHHPWGSQALTNHSHSLCCQCPLLDVLPPPGCFGAQEKALAGSDVGLHPLLPGCCAGGEKVAGAAVGLGPPPWLSSLPAVGQGVGSSHSITPHTCPVPGGHQYPLGGCSKPRTWGPLAQGLGQRRSHHAPQGRAHLPHPQKPQAGSGGVAPLSPPCPQHQLPFPLASGQDGAGCSVPAQAPSCPAAVLPPSPQPPHTLPQSRYQKAATHVPPSMPGAAEPRGPSPLPGGSCGARLCPVG